MVTWEVEREEIHSRHHAALGRLEARLEPTEACELTNGVLSTHVDLMNHDDAPELEQMCPFMPGIGAAMTTAAMPQHVMTGGTRSAWSGSASPTMTRSPEQRMQPRRRPTGRFTSMSSHSCSRTERSAQRTGRRPPDPVHGRGVALGS